MVLDIDSQAQRGVPSDKEIGKMYDLKWAERFHYIGTQKSKMEAYLKSNTESK